MLQPILTLPSGTELRGGQAGSAVENLTLHTAETPGKNSPLALLIQTTSRPKSGRTQAAACKLLPETS